MQNLLPLNIQQEFTAFLKLRDIRTQLQECQHRLTAVFPPDERSFIRDNRTKNKLNVIINILTHRLSDIKNIASGLDSVINLP